ncbi:MAG: hypothetical protein Q9181_001037 [Wetmoreana brouardii]
MDGEGTSTEHVVEFGYTFQRSVNYPAEPAPAPPHGPGLLLPHQIRDYERYLQEVGSAEPQVDEAFWDPFAEEKEGEGPEALPPTYHGSVTYGPPSPSDQNAPTDPFTPANDRYISANPPPTTGHMSEFEVPASNPNSHASVRQHMSDVATFGFGQSTSAPSHEFVHHTPAPQYRVPAGASGWESAQMHPHTLGPSLDVSYHGLPQVANVDSNLNRQHNLRFGSDPHFDQSHFVPPSHQPTEERVTNGMISQFGCLESQGSVDSTRPSSPQADRQEAPFSHQSIDLASSPQDASRGASDVGSQSRAHRSPTFQQGEASALQDGAQQQVDRIQTRNKRRARRAARDPGTQEAARGRRGRASGTRPTLSQEERKKRHKDSEHRRRTNLNIPRSGLMDLVPGMAEASLSRNGEIRFLTAWLQGVLEDNERMENQLRLLDGPLVMDD